MFTVGDKVEENGKIGTIVAIHTKGTVDVLFEGSQYPKRRQDHQVQLVEQAYLSNPYRSNGEVVPFKQKKGLSRKQRASLPNEDFCVIYTTKSGRTKRSFPINDYYHGRLALVYSMWPNNAHNRQKVKRCVFARYPELIDWWNNTEWVQDHPGEEYYEDEPRMVANPGHEVYRGPDNISYLRRYFKDNNGRTWRVLDIMKTPYTEFPYVNQQYKKGTTVVRVERNGVKKIFANKLEGRFTSYYGDYFDQTNSGDYRTNPHHMHIHWKHVNGGGAYRNMNKMRMNPSKERVVPIGAFPDDYEWLEQHMIKYLSNELYWDFDGDIELVKGMTEFANKALFPNKQSMRATFRRFYDIYKNLYFKSPWIQVWRCIQVYHGDPISFGKDLGIHWAYTRRAAYDFCVENFEFGDDYDLIMFTGKVSRIDVDWVDSIEHGLVYSLRSFIDGRDTGEDELIVVNPQYIRDLQYDKLRKPDNYR